MVSETSSITDWKAKIRHCYPVEPDEFSVFSAHSPGRNKNLIVKFAQRLLYASFGVLAKKVQVLTDGLIMLEDSKKFRMN